MTEFFAQAAITVATLALALACAFAVAQVIAKREARKKAKRNEMWKELEKENALKQQHLFDSSAPKKFTVLICSDMKLKAANGDFYLETGSVVTVSEKGLCDLKNQRADILALPE